MLLVPPRITHAIEHRAHPGVMCFVATVERRVGKVFAESKLDFRIVDAKLHRADATPRSRHEHATDRSVGDRVGDGHARATSPIRRRRHTEHGVATLVYAAARAEAGFERGAAHSIPGAQ